MYIGIRDGYLTRGGGPYVHAFISVIHHASPHRVGGHSLLASGSFGLDVVGHDTVFGGPTLDTKAHLSSPIE